MRDSRHALQDTLEGRMTDIIEELTQRKVVAFMSASHQDPDLQVELLRSSPRRREARPTTSFRVGGRRSYETSSAGFGRGDRPLLVTGGRVGADVRGRQTTTHAFAAAA